MSKAVVLNIFFSFTIISLSLIDIVNCDLYQLDASGFDEFIRSNSHVAVLFKSSEECPTCTDAVRILAEAPQPQLLQQEIQKGFTVDKQLSTRFGITNFPALVYFRHGNPALYDNTLSSDEDLPELIDWLENSATVATKDLNDDSFEHLTQASTGATTGDWLVIFYESSCTCCLKTFPAIESVALRVSHRMNVARVDVETNVKLKERFSIQQCPTTILFKQGKMYMYEPGLYEPKSLLSFVEGWYRNVKATPVPTEPTAFDKLTDSIALFIKEKLNDPTTKLPVLAVLAMVPVVMAAVLFFTCRKSTSLDKGKSD